jgi:hypothetical protein
MEYETPDNRFRSVGSKEDKNKILKGYLFPIMGKDNKTGLKNHIR